MIEVRNLTKRYGGFLAVNNISFTVNDGEILGFLGPNGAGKTTTMNMLTGYICATEGDCIINGHNILSDPERAKKEIGYLPENPPLYGDMTVREYLGFVAEIKNVPKKERAKTIENVMKTVMITDMRNRMTKNLSKGYRQRVGLAQAMMGSPGVLVLDEPTIGLDPKQIGEMRDVIRSLGKKHTVILSSHILSEVSAMCDRVMIINKGNIVAEDTTENLGGAFSGGGKLQIRVKAKESAVLAALSGIKNITVGQSICKEAETVDITVSSTDDTDIREAVSFALMEKQLPILMFKPMNISLEEVFLQVTAGADITPLKPDGGTPDDKDDKKRTAKAERENAVPADKSGDASGGEK